MTSNRLCADDPRGQRRAFARFASVLCAFALAATLSPPLAEAGDDHATRDVDVSDTSPSKADAGCRQRVVPDGKQLGAGLRPLLGRGVHRARSALGQGRRVRKQRPECRRRRVTAHLASRDKDARQRKGAGSGRPVAAAERGRGGGSPVAMCRMDRARCQKACRRKGEQCPAAVRKELGGGPASGGGRRGGDGGGGGEVGHSGGGGDVGDSGGGGGSGGDGDAGDNRSGGKRGRLPHSGFDVILIALLGLALAGAGIGLRHAAIIRSRAFDPAAGRRQPR